MMKQFLFFIFLIGFASASVAKDCNIKPKLGSKNFIIGYGSLMERDSRISTNPAAYRVEPVMIKGFQRIWGHNGKNYKTTFLTIIEKQDSQVNAIFYPLSIQGLQKLDEREKSYCRVKVDTNNLNFYGRKVKVSNTNFWVYAANTARLQEPSESHPIAQSYVDIFLNGCMQIQQEYKIETFAKDCVETTSGWSEHWVNDRVHARRPFQLPNAYKIDQLLGKYFNHYYNHKFN